MDIIRSYELRDGGSIPSCPAKICIGGFVFSSLTRSEQGDLGEHRAIYELSRLGYIISKPLSVQIPYDLVVEKNGTLSRVQVKTSKHRVGVSGFEINLATSGGNTRVNTINRFDPARVEMIFVMVADGRCWLIPTSEVIAGKSITVGNPNSKYLQFQICEASHHEVTLAPLLGKQVIDGEVIEVELTKDDLQQLLDHHTMSSISKKYHIEATKLRRYVHGWQLVKSSSTRKNFAC